MRLLLIVILVLSSTLAFASPQPGRAPSAENIKGLMAQALKERKPMSEFWMSVHQKYGPAAIAPMVSILENEKERDELRWATLFGVARLAGRDSTSILKKFSSHKSWLLRDASLRAAAAMNASELAPEIEAALNDKALVVRTTAVDVVGHMKLKRSMPLLIEALNNPINYRAEKPLWIHSHILKVVTDMNYQEATPKLIELLEARKDESLRQQIVATLEKLTGKSFAGRTLTEQVYLWKRNTVSDKTF